MHTLYTAVSYILFFFVDRDPTFLGYDPLVVKEYPRLNLKANL